MESRSEKTLVVETGILCNNRCVFCYQNGYRRVREIRQLVDASVVRERMEWGIANGFSDLSFTGGEPTIRPDFLDLVAYAAELGYVRISVTTNGSRLCDTEFFRSALNAGLNGMGVSIHGMTAEVHESVAGRKGAFRQAVLAIRNGSAAAAKLGGNRFRLNTFTVLHRGNTGNLDELTGMLAALGVRLMILQPPVTGKSNVTPLAEVSLSEVVSAVARAAAAASAGHWKIKPFNIPPCLLRQWTSGLDLTMYERSTFREHDAEDAGGRSGGEDVGFVRFAACEKCGAAPFCQGLSLTLAPESDIIEPIMDAAAATAGSAGPLWLTGTELLSSGGISDVVRKSKASFTWVCTGGTHRCGPALFDAVVSGGNGRAGIAFVHQSKDPASSDRIVCNLGNDGYILDSIDLLKRSGLKLPVAVAGSADQSFLALLESVVGTGIASISPISVVVAPWWRTARGTYRDLESIVAFCRESGIGPVTVGVTGMKPDEPSKFRALEPLRGITMDTTMNVPATPFENHLWSILNWSVPLGCVGGRRDGPVLTVRSLEVLPFT